MIKIKTDPLNNLLIISKQHMQFGNSIKFQQFTNKYNLTKSKTNHNKYKIIHSYTMTSTNKITIKHDI